MEILDRTDFSRGWVPDSDATGGPKNALLRADNLVLEQGTPVLRPPARKIAFLPDADVHSLYTAVLNGTRYRFAGAGNNVSVNGSNVTGVDGSGDVAFGSAFGQVLFARGTTTRKYHGSLTPWGIAAPGSAPVITPVASDGKTFFDGAVGGMVQDEGDDETPHPMAAAAGYDGTANGATAIWPKPTTKRAVITHQMGAPTSFLVYDASATGGADDLLTFYLWCAEPTKLVSVQVIVDVNQANFREDWYEHTWQVDELEPLSPASVPISKELQAEHRQALRDANLRNRPRNRDGDSSEADAENAEWTSTIRREKESWSKLAVRRGGMTRVGSTSGKNWATVGAVRIILTVTESIECRVDQMRIIQNTIGGTYRWCYVSAIDTGTYVGLSAPSPLSLETTILGQAADVAIPAGPGTQCWVFRMGGVLDRFYRVAVLAAAGGTVRDTVSDVDALTTNIPLETDNTTPPANIIGIAGPYYDRTVCLTRDGFLWVSRRRNPESFATGQVIRICGADEQPLWVKQSLGGLHVGTSKDIYRIDGTGAELPDGTIDFTKVALHLDHPPISDGVAQDGSLLLYLSRLGWRGVSGAGSHSIVGGTATLYQGQVRHGVGPVNLATGRFRATIGHQQFLAMTPEGSETSSTGTIYRHAPADGPAIWYRHYYPTAWRSLYTEPDGTILGGDTAGQVWQIDAPGYTHGDDGTAIYVELWTPVDDDGTPYHRKDPQDWRLSVATASGGGSAALHLDGSATPAIVVAAGTATGSPPTLASLASIAETLTFRRAQLRLTHAAIDASFAFKFFGHGLGYRRHPPLQAYADLKPVELSPARRRFGGLRLGIDTLGANATVTIVVDGVTQKVATINTTSPRTQYLELPGVTGRDLWAIINGLHELYQSEPIVLQTLPVLSTFWEERPLSVSTVRRRFGGLNVVIDTLGVATTVTPILDGVAQPAFTISTSDGLSRHIDMPNAVGRDLWARIQNATGFEVYQVAPIVLQEFPPAWNGLSAPQTFGSDGVKTIAGLQVRVCTRGTTRTFTVRVDGVARGTFTALSGNDDPVDVTWQPTAAVEGVEFQLAADANLSDAIELWSWAPLVTARRPLGVKVYDTGVLPLGDRELTWLRHLAVQALVAAPLTVQAYLDGVLIGTAVSATPPVGDTVVPLDFGRGVVGRQPRLVLTSSAPFYPRSVKVYRRTSGMASDKPAVTLPLTLQEQPRGVA